MTTFDINATYDEYGDRDLIIGAMFLDTIQWMGISEDLDQDLLFTEQQYRMAGEKIRSTSNYPEFFRVYKNHFIEMDHTDEFFSLDKRLDFRYQFKEMVADPSYEGKQSVARVLREWREEGGSHTSRLSWQIEMLETLEHAILKGFNLLDFVTEYTLDAYNDTVSNIVNIEFVVQSNNLLLTCHNGFWKIHDTLGWDRNTSTIADDYTATLPYNFDNTFNAFNTNHYPLVVRSKAPYDQIYHFPDGEEPEKIARYFPVLSVDNFYNKLYFYCGRPGEFLDVGGNFELDPIEYGIGTLFGGGESHALNIAAVQIPNNDNETYFFFHRMLGDDPDSQLMNESVTGDKYPITQAVYYYLDDAEFYYPMVLEPSFQFRDAITSFDGKVFSIDTIELLTDDTEYLGSDVVQKQYLLITGIFTLVSDTVEHTNIAVFDVVTGSFIPVDTSSIDMNYWETVLVNDSNDSDSSVYKLDSISATQRIIGVDSDDDSDIIGLRSHTFFSIGLKYKDSALWDDLLDIPPFFVLSCKLTKDDGDNLGVEATLSEKSHFTPDNGVGYKGYLIEGSSYLVQKFGFGMDNIPNDHKTNEGSAREILLYTGKGIFYCDAIAKTISGVSKYNGNKVTPFSVTNLNGEDSNFYVWCNPTGDTDKYYSGSSRLMYDESYTKYVSVDDSRFYNLIDKTKQVSVDYDGWNTDNYFANRYRLWVASGWSSMGGLANYPATYNNLHYPDNNYNTHIKLENSKDDSALIDNYYNASGSALISPTFPNQTKIILVVAENQLFSKIYTEDNFEMARNKIYYSYKEIDLPIGYGQIVRNAYMRPADYN